MMAVNELRNAGFRVRLIDDRIGITPSDSLSAEQRVWVASNREVILSELKKEAANESEHEDRWRLFIDMAAEYGVNASEVQARFTEQDVSDLLDEPIERLSLHARTISESIHCYRLRGTNMAETCT